jgi:hypothetical protein
MWIAKSCVGWQIKKMVADGNMLWNKKDVQTDINPKASEIKQKNHPQQAFLSCSNRGKGQ